MKYFHKDYSKEIVRYQKEVPLYGFLAFLMENSHTYELKVRVTKQIGDEKIRDITLQFKEEKAHAISLTNLRLFDFISLMENPHLLIQHFMKDEALYDARSRYDQSNKKANAIQSRIIRFGAKDMLDSDFHLATTREELEEQEEEVKYAIYHGALFCERLTELYRGYREQLDLPVPETGMPEGDYIEVDLLNILADPDVAGDIKDEARQMLERYREKQAGGTGVNKNQTARLTLRTIKEHYLDKK